MMETWAIAAVLVVALLLLRLLAVLQRGLGQYLGYALLLIGNLVFAAWVLGAERFVHVRPSGRAWPTVELGIAAAACLLLVGVPSLLERRARRAFAEDRLDRAARLIGLKELIMPGRAAAAERELFDEMREARA